MFRSVIHTGDADITSLAVSGGAIWLGTRNGYLVVLDSYLMLEGKDPLLGLQHCGSGKVKCVVPLVPLQNAISKLQVSKMWIGYSFTLFGCVVTLIFHCSLRIIS